MRRALLRWRWLQLRWWLFDGCAQERHVLVAHGWWGCLLRGTPTWCFWLLSVCWHVPMVRVPGRCASVDVYRVRFATAPAGAQCPSWPNPNIASFVLFVCLIGTVVSGRRGRGVMVLCTYCGLDNKLLVTLGSAAVLGAGCAQELWWMVVRLASTMLHWLCLCCGDSRPHSCTLAMGVESTQPCSLL